MHRSIPTNSLLSLALLAFTVVRVHGQTTQWMHQGGDSGEGRGVSADGAGNCYVVGSVGTPVRFDALEQPSHFADAFIAKYDPAGVVQWVRTGGDNLIDEAHDIATDELGNSYVTGFFSTNGPFPTVVFDDTVLTGNGSKDLYVAKYDADGVLLWLRFGGGSGADEGNGVALTVEGDVLVSGSFQGTAVFGADTLVSADLSDVLLLRFTSAGDPVWSTRAGGNGDDRATRLEALGNGDLACVGDFQQTAFFDGNTITSVGLYNIFLARFDADGNAQWAVKAGSTTTFAGDEAFDIEEDSNGDLILCGEIAGPAIFDGNAIGTNGGPDLYIARYDASGNALWIHHAGGPHADHAYGLAIDAEGNSYLTGQVDDGATTVFDSITLAPFGNECVFLAKYDAAGAIQWVHRYAPGSGRAVAVRNGGCLHFTGGASGIVGQPAFDSIPWQYTDRAIFTAYFCEALATGIAFDPRTDALVLFPDPALDRVYVTVPLGWPSIGFYTIVDISGRAVRQGAYTPGLPLDVTGIVGGTYTVYLRDREDAHHAVGRFVKE